MLNIRNPFVFQGGFVYVFYTGIAQDSLIGSSLELFDFIVFAFYLGYLNSVNNVNECLILA